jgi:hypothetical protein
MLVRNATRAFRFGSLGPDGRQESLHLSLDRARRRANPCDWRGALDAFLHRFGSLSIAMIVSGGFTNFKRLLPGARWRRR